MYRVRSLALLLATALAFGCFAFDEMDEGMKRWSQNSPHATVEPDPPASPPRQRRLAGWEGARSLGSDAASADIVRCSLDGHSQYMRRSDCVNHGGQVGS